MRTRLEYQAATSVTLEGTAEDHDSNDRRFTYSQEVVLDPGDTCTVEWVLGDENATVYHALGSGVLGDYHKISSVDAARVRALINTGDLVPVPAEPAARLRPPNPDPVATIVAGLRKKPLLLFKVLRGLDGLKLAGPWVEQEQPGEFRTWRRHDAVTGWNLVIVTEPALGNTNWHIAFPHVPALGVRTDFDNLDACLAYAEESLASVGYSLC
jgi:hypothetical protein